MHELLTSPTDSPSNRQLSPKERFSSQTGNEWMDGLLVVNMYAKVVQPLNLTAASRCILNQAHP